MEVNDFFLESSSLVVDEMEEQYLSQEESLSSKCDHLIFILYMNRIDFEALRDQIIT